ncbi:LacI family DNA-binding transcriptional regulator [soil metagenome]
MATTIRDVAQRAGVSIATVSRVLRDSDGVTPRTRARVTTAVTEMQFTPSQLGRQLAERRYAANGIVFPDLSGPYYAEVVLGYESVAAELGRSVLILSTHGRNAAPEMVEQMAGRCDGLVILGRTVSDEVVDRLAARGTPLVLLARPPAGRCDSVRAEGKQSASRLAAHLIEEGARRITFLGDPEGSFDVAERWTGVADTVARAGGALTLEPTKGGEEAGARMVTSLLAGPRGTSSLPDALICANDELALGVLAELAAQGVDVPGQVMVTGWDDVMAARYAGLTTVRQPMRELGGTAARLLDEQISGSRTEPRHELLPTELIVRTSTVGNVKGNQ